LKKCHLAELANLPRHPVHGLVNPAPRGVT
jgi:hypothetical protein